MQVRGSKSFLSFLHVHEYNRWIKKSAFYSEVQLGRLQQQVYHGCKSTTWRSVKVCLQTTNSDCESFSDSSHTSFIFITNINCQITMCLQVSACPRPERVSNSVWTEVMTVFVVKRQSSKSCARERSVFLSTVSYHNTSLKKECKERNDPNSKQIRRTFTLLWALILVRV